MYDGLPRFWADYNTLIYTNCWELMKSVGGHGSSSMLFVMKVMVWHFASEPHKVKTTLILVLPSKCRGDFSAILQIYKHVKLIVCVGFSRFLRIYRFPVHKDEG
jgi:hypothetical protein